MLIKASHKRKKYIIGRGFVDVLSSVLKLLKSSTVPALRSIGSYVSTNKDLIAKPLLGAVVTLAATGLTAGNPALISHIVNKNERTLALPKNDDQRGTLALPPNDKRRSKHHRRFA